MMNSQAQPPSTSCHAWHRNTSTPTVFAPLWSSMRREIGTYEFVKASFKAKTLCVSLFLYGWICEERCRPCGLLLQRPELQSVIRRYAVHLSSSCGESERIRGIIQVVVSGGRPAAETPQHGASE
uniref:Uncharacterized protein n=1 Tax=Knipowitschia caucasica TaxID=637954 RepID=A0AAV2K7M6_KNICA